MTATARVDLTDLDMWARGVPYAEFARLRAERPVAWFGEPALNSGFWSVHRYADIVTASRDTATFSSFGCEQLFSQPRRPGAGRARPRYHRTRTEANDLCPASPGGRPWPT
jgi:cytochrome P450